MRRHLGAAIDLLLEYGEHPYQALIKGRQEEQTIGGAERAVSPGGTPGNGKHVEPSIGDNLDALGIGLGLTETLEGQE